MSDTETVCCVWDGHNDDNTDTNDDDLGYNGLYEPWRDTVVSVKTAPRRI